jgi:hypothetical protein
MQVMSVFWFEELLWALFHFRLRSVSTEEARQHLLEEKRRNRCYIVLVTIIFVVLQQVLPEKEIRAGALITNLKLTIDRSHVSENHLHNHQHKSHQWFPSQQTIFKGFKVIVVNCPPPLMKNLQTSLDHNKFSSRKQFRKEYQLNSSVDSGRIKRLYRDEQKHF